MVKVGTGLEIFTMAGVELLANPAAHGFTGLILMSPFTPPDKSDVTVTLFPPAIQVVPFEVFVPIFQPEGNKYS